jgi:hypothetical protein
MVIGLGGHACSCANFIRQVENEMADFQTTLEQHNRREHNRYRHARR